MLPLGAFLTPPVHQHPGRGARTAQLSVQGFVGPQGVCLTPPCPTPGTPRQQVTDPGCCSPVGCRGEGAWRSLTPTRPPQTMICHSCSEKPIPQCPHSVRVGQNPKKGPHTPSCSSARTHLGLGVPELHWGIWGQKEEEQGCPMEKEGDAGVSHGRTVASPPALWNPGLPWKPPPAPGVSGER